MKPSAHRNDEGGFILITTMLILVVLTFIGIAATRNSTVELQIAANDRTVKELFYDAESAAMEAAGRLNNEDDPDELVAPRSSLPWLIDTENDGTDPVNPDNDPTADKWTGNDKDDSSLLSAIPNPDPDKEIRLAAVDHGILSGGDASSIKITAESVHGYHLFGYVTKDNGSKLIEIGYKKRF